MIFMSFAAYSHELSVSCSTATYGCSGKICGWWMDSVPIDQLPKKVTLIQDSQNASAWKAETAEIIKNFSVTSRFHMNIEAADENKITFDNWVELSKDGVIAAAPGYASPYGNHFSIRLRSGEASLQYSCLIKLIK